MKERPVMRDCGCELLNVSRIKKAFEASRFSHGEDNRTVLIGQSGLGSQLGSQARRCRIK